MINCFFAVVGVNPVILMFFLHCCIHLTVDGWHRLTSRTTQLDPGCPPVSVREKGLEPEPGSGGSSWTQISDVRVDFGGLPGWFIPLSTCVLYLSIYIYMYICYNIHPVMNCGSGVSPLATAVWSLVYILHNHTSPMRIYPGKGRPTSVNGRP